MVSAVFLPLLGSLAPDIINGVFALVGVGVGTLATSRVQRRQQEDTHRRAREDARQDRIRDAYMTVLRAALTYNQVAAQQSVIRVGDTVEARNQRHQAALTILAETLMTADLVLRLEDNDPEIVDLFSTLRKAYTSYMTGLEMNAYQPGSIDLSTLQEEQRIMFDSLNALILKMRQRLGANRSSTAVSRRRWQVWLR